MMKIQLSGPGNEDWLGKMAQELGINSGQVIDAVLLDFRAKIAAESCLFDVEDMSLKQFRFGDEGLILGEEQWDFLVGEYLDFYDCLKTQMILEAKVTDGDGEY